MKRSHVCLTLCALWMQALIPLPVTEGLSCFTCTSKTNEGCKNEDLKSGHRNNLFSETCPGTDAICIKQSIEVKHYYEEHYNRAELKKYYTAMDEAAECHGIGHKPHTAVTGAPGDNETSTSSDDTHQELEGTAARLLPRQQKEMLPPTQLEMLQLPLPDDDDVLWLPTVREAGLYSFLTKACSFQKYPKAFPEPEALVERSDQRWIYSCGNRSEWHHVEVGHCHRHTDGILEESICICAEDLCNGATARQAVPFLVLAVALVHLQRMIG
ncbi:hypothetical protein FJT64_014540 [Amphibalanus amphitrite]|uniref:Protein sleepless n=1 Tax=Amphibalanus amphitrite TaxID=1232801 RepID=A0A6A4V5V4_AMPAM|nr:hypothetical protein FJT64_014540 [Amphibalanus amphitrite]